MAKTLDLTLYTPHSLQQEVHNNNSRFKVLNWGRRTGKSVFVVNYTLLKAIEKPGRYWIVAPTYKQAKNIYWYDIVLHHVPRELVAKKNESELIITLLNGSTIELKGADNEDSLRGAGVQGLVLDEYAFMKPHVWDLILRPMLADSKGWSVFISTPNGYNHFYDIATTAMDSTQTNWYYSHATSYDNPHVDDEEIDSIKQNMNDNQFAQEYLAEFRKMQGLVYPQFERDTHVLTAGDIPTEGTHYFTVDFGFSNPTAVLFCTVDYDNNLYVWDEVYKPGMVTEQIATAIRSKVGDRQYRYKLGDGAAAQEIANLNAAPYTMGIEPAEKGHDSIRTGIRLISDRLKIQGNGKPRLFISEVCKNLIWEFETYRYPDKKDDHNESEDPIKENDHACFTGDTIVNGSLISDIGVYMGAKPVWEYVIDGVRLKATKDHPVLTHRGFVGIDTLRYNDVICRNKLFTTVSNGTGTKIALTGLIGCTISVQKRQIQAIERDCTAIYGERLTVKSLLAITSIILMGIARITILPISNVLVLLNTLVVICLKSVRSGLGRILSWLSQRQQNGQRLQRGRSEEAKSAKRTQNTYQGIKYRDNVTFVKKNMLPKLRSVDTATLTVKPLRYVGVVKTYNLTTSSGTYRANGVTVSNCDALRYLLLKLEHNVQPLKIHKPAGMLKRKYNR